MHKVEKHVEGILFSFRLFLSLFFEQDVADFVQASRHSLLIPRPASRVLLAASASCCLGACCTKILYGTYMEVCLRLITAPKTINLHRDLQRNRSELQPFEDSPGTAMILAYTVIGLGCHYYPQARILCERVCFQRWIRCALGAAASGRFGLRCLLPGALPLLVLAARCGQSTQEFYRRVYEDCYNCYKKLSPLYPLKNQLNIEHPRNTST